MSSKREDFYAVFGYILGLVGAFIFTLFGEIQKDIVLTEIGVCSYVCGALYFYYKTRNYD